MAQCLVPPRRYRRETAVLDIARDFIRFALKNDHTLVFRLLEAKETTTGYKLDYKISMTEPYLAISHAWTDRTGPGSTIVVTDLAPWPISMSPAKRQFLDWLFKIQHSPDKWSSWFWLDLFCIDQTREDELLFSQQLQQIPKVFQNAKSCVALLTSWPCQAARDIPELPENEGENTRYDYVNDWLREHTSTCCCPALSDAWLTRVWTRQEVLYSKSLMLVTANNWLSHTVAKASDISDDLWTVQPCSYDPPRATDGVRELAGCLITWCTRYDLSTTFFSSAVIAGILRLLIRGEVVSCSLPSLPSENCPLEVHPDWFAFNWSMIANSSIRVTSHTRDAILSQMLLLPGYHVPETPWSMPLQDLMVDCSRQYRQLLGRYQLVPMLFDAAAKGERPGWLAPALSSSFENASLMEILQSVGSPCTYPAGVFVDEDRTTKMDASLYAYEIDDHPRYRVLHIIDIEQNPGQAAEFFAMLAPLFSQAADCRATWNMRECLQEIESELQMAGNSADTLKKALKHCVARLVHTNAFKRPHINRATNPGKPYLPEEVDSFVIPGLRAVEIHYQNNVVPSHRNLLFGELPVGEEGSIWGLGIDKVTKLEFGIAAVEDRPGDLLHFKASGVLMPTISRNRRTSPSTTEKRFPLKPVS
ncbi:hypothetical protein AYL99_00710 [Fonsecaea erecta]|uniref:Heterokaryon incompatibility domain-containing protein n=1 Tax=Fonsecaea erecta TaxID=1367422 RepID=A0A178ZY04_9EURO|nr:hypothetical protein AYL99_00710 [Fonsecaea erecta]OAP64738.1 hypothetical protein AYL99_00710 [Fonsecaea erecta]